MAGENGLEGGFAGIDFLHFFQKDIAVCPTAGKIGPLRAANKEICAAGTGAIFVGQPPGQNEIPHYRRLSGRRDRRK